MLELYWIEVMSRTESSFEQTEKRTREVERMNIVHTALADGDDTPTHDLNRDPHVDAEPFRNELTRQLS